MKTRKSKKMILFALLTIVAGFVAFLIIPFSPTGMSYHRLTEEKAQAAAADTGLFSEADINSLPLPVGRYFSYCGYLGKPKMSYMRANIQDVDFVMTEDRTIKMNYEQLNLVERPERFALISSSVNGLPFEGLDSYENGKGRMMGRLSKVITLFDQRGESMDRSCLVTWLSECLMVPSAALQSFVKWEPVDGTHARASVTWDGVTVGGIFTFSETGELVEFRTGDRVAIDMDGKETRADWSAYFQDYRETDGILQPTVIKSTWHYEWGDCVYFNENESELTIRYQ